MVRDAEKSRQERRCHCVRRHCTAAVMMERHLPRVQTWRGVTRLTLTVR